MKATNFDTRITRAMAQRILFNGWHDKYGFDVMCKEYGDDDDWVGLSMEDLDEDGGMDEDWETFEVWFALHMEDSEKKHITELLELEKEVGA